MQRKYDAIYKNEFKYSDCGAVGGNQICIGVDGNITICHGEWNKQINSIGNINDISFKDIFASKEYKMWNENITINKPKCLKCPYLYICGGGCKMEAKEMFNSYKEIDKPFCIYTKKIGKIMLEEMYEYEISNQTNKKSINKEDVKS